MQNIPIRRRWALASGALLLSIASLAVAADVRHPVQLSAASSSQPAASRQPQTANHQPPASTQTQQQQQRQRMEGAYFQFEVDRIARILPGNPAPSYPPASSVSNQNGKAVIGVVIDENGLPMVNTFTVVEATENAYALAAIEALRQYKFTPAEIAGRPVRMWVLLPFEFVRGRGNTPPGGAGAAPARGQAYFQFEVERMARLLPGNTPPAFPASLRQAGVRGKVIVSFIVDTTGKADMNSLKVVESTHNLFTEELLKVLPSYSFVPAQVGNRKVRVHVQIPFEWIL
jgi:TonB family protein